MNPSDTLQPFQDLKARKTMVVHWGTFRLGDEPVHVPPADMRRVMEQGGIGDRLLNLTHGDTLYL